MTRVLFLMCLWMAPLVQAEPPDHTDGPNIYGNDHRGPNASGRDEQEQRRRNRERAETHQAPSRHTYTPAPKPPKVAAPTYCPSQSEQESNALAGIIAKDFHTRIMADLVERVKNPKGETEAEKKTREGTSRLDAANVKTHFTSTLASLKMCGLSPGLKTALRNAFKELPDLKTEAVALLGAKAINEDETNVLASLNTTYTDAKEKLLASY